MNKIYRVIWSKAQNTWIAVSEIAKAQGKSHSQVTVNNEITTEEKEEIGSSLFSRNILSAAILMISISGAIVDTAYADGGIYINDGTDSNCLKSTDSTLLSTGLTSPLTPLINSLATPIGNVDSAVNSLTSTLNGIPLLGGILVTNLASTSSITSSAAAATAGTSLVNTAALGSVLTSANGAGCVSSDAATQTNRILFYNPTAAGGASGADPTNLSIGGDAYVNGSLFLDGVNVGSSISSLSTSLSSLSSGLSSLSSISSGLSNTNSVVSSISNGLSDTNVSLSAVSSNLSNVSSGLSTTNSVVSTLSSGLSATNVSLSAVSSNLSNVSSGLSTVSPQPTPSCL